MSSLAFELPGHLGGDATMITRTFSQLSLAVQQLGQWENSGDITPEILLQAVNYGLLEAYDVMVARWADYYTLDGTFPLVAGTAIYPLLTAAPDFFKLRHLDYTADLVVSASSRFTRMLPHELDGAHVYSGATASSGRPPRYRVQGGNLVFAPTPGTGTVRIYYIPIAPQFTDVDDASVVLFEVPIEERLVVQIAQHELLERSDLDTTDCDRKIGKLTAQLRTAADSRDAGEPQYLSPYGPPRDRRGAFLDGDVEW